MTPEERLAFIRRLAVDRLNDLQDGWSVEDETVVGPGSLGLVFADHEGMPAQHIDIGFALNRDRPAAPIVWDCVSGYGDGLEAALEHALDVWMECTAPVVLELLAQSGEFAAHIHPGDPDGLERWHCIHGGVLGFGHGAGAEAMQSWVLDHPLLPALGDALVAQFDRPNLNGIKFLFGADVAEVRINGQGNEAASKALAGLSWPRLDPPAFARCFVLAIHAHDESAAT